LSKRAADRRQALLQELEQLADQAIFGTVSETYRTCGQPTCRCHHGGPKHGPHLYVSYRGEEGKTTGYYVPKAAVEQIRGGVMAWHTIQQHLRELAEMNKDELLEKTRRKKKR